MFSSMIRAMQAKSQLLGAMFARLRIDPAKAARIRGGTALAQASRTCLNCGSDQTCAEWLTQATEDGARRPPSFCPNKQFLAEACVRQASWPN